MIGWWIVVSMRSPEERDRADQEARRAAILAQWETGADGIRWIEFLHAAQGGDFLARDAGDLAQCHEVRLVRLPALQAIQPPAHRARLRGRIGGLNCA